jgi:hypothetical protein
MGWLRPLWEAWKRFAHRFGNFQSRLFLLIFYYIVAAPFALALKLLSDPLRLRATTGAWTPRRQPAGDALSAARREF